MRFVILAKDGRIAVIQPSGPGQITNYLTKEEAVKLIEELATAVLKTKKGK